MGLKMDEWMSGAGLSASLARIASHPDQLDCLSQILGIYCHQSRNLLHAIKLSLFLAKRNGPTSDSNIWGELESVYLSVERFFDRLHSICRPMSVTPVRMPLALLVEDRLSTWNEWLAERGRRLEVIAPLEPAIGDYDPARMAEGLDAFVAWRGDVGELGGSARLHWRAEAGHFLLDWSEPPVRCPDRSGIYHEQPDRLALPLLARVVSAHRGTLDVAVQDGLCVRLRWPLDVRRP